MVGESDVPLTEDVIKRPPSEFSATFMEWASDNIEQVFKQGTAAGASATLYTVPDNFTLFITSAWVSVSCITGNPADRSGTILFNNSLRIIDTSIYPGNTVNSNTLSFPMPLKINTKAVIEILSSANSRSRGGFQGFLLPKKISIR